MPTLTLPGNFDRLVSDLTVNGNSAGVETQLTALTILLNSLQLNGQVAWYHGLVFFANNANNKTLNARVSDGTTNYDLALYNAALQNLYARVDFFIWRISATALLLEAGGLGFGIATLQGNNSAAVIDVTTQALTVSLRANGVAANDVSQKGAFLAIWR